MIPHTKSFKIEKGHQISTDLPTNFCLPILNVKNVFWGLINGNRPQCTLDIVFKMI